MDILFEQVSFTYQGIGAAKKTVLKEVNLHIPSKQITAVIGKTSSGKTTLTHLCNGILTATNGQVKVGDLTISQETSEEDLFRLKQQVGMVFQFPETQLFEKTVLADVMFGALNFGFSKEDAQKMAIRALKRMGIDEVYFEQSPLSLSGGQMRRVAIAGVLVYAPKVLVFDEPTAGLDMQSKREFIELCKELRQDGLTIIMVSHDMEEVANLADYVAVMIDGTIRSMETTENVFYDVQFDDYGLDRPQVVKLYRALHNKYGFSMIKRPLAIDELIAGLQAFNKGEYHE